MDNTTILYPFVFINSIFFDEIHQKIFILYNQLYLDISNNLWYCVLLERQVTTMSVEEFYYGNIIPHEIPIDNGSDYANVNKLIIRYDEILTSTLTEKQKEIFSK